MSIVDPEIEKYIAENASKEPEVLQQLNRDTNVNVLMPQMLSGHVQGRVLSILSKLVNPENVLEVGTYTGYSALCFAEGLKEGGVVHTIDINEELEEMVAKYISEAGMEGKIKQYIGNALKIIPEMDITFDLVFIDADKKNYLNYYNLIKGKVRPGGIILVDNVLWSGKVAQTERVSKDTQNMMDFNAAVAADPDVEKVILPVRDGITVIRKI